MLSLYKPLLLACALIAALLPAAAYAQGQGQGRGQGQGKGPAMDRPSQGQPGQSGKARGGQKHGGKHDSTGSLEFGLSVTFSRDERSLIHDWFAHNPVQPAALPPGIAQNLQRGKPLPPGIAKKQLPPSLLDRLPRRDGYDYLLIGASVVLVAAATGIIVDIIVDAL